MTGRGISHQRRHSELADVFVARNVVRMPSSLTRLFDGQPVPSGHLEADAAV